MMVARIRIGLGGAFVGFLVLLTTSQPGFGQVCTGDCSADRRVSVDELVLCVNLALGTEPRSSCPACDPNQDGAVSIDELVESVNASLGRITLPTSGSCVRPGSSGLEACASGTSVNVFRCDDETSCLGASVGRTLIGTGSTAANGTFSLSLDGCMSVGATLLFEALVEPASQTRYRTMDFGPLFSGSASSFPGAGAGLPALDGVQLGPNSEAAVRFVEETGLENCDAGEVAGVFTAVAAANASLSFAGLSPRGAADLAEQNASQDDQVQDAVRCGLPTFTPTNSPTPTVTETPTGTPTRTDTPTFTPTPTPALNVAVEVNPDPAVAGERLRVAVTVANAGPAPLSNVIVRAAVPAEVDAFSVGLVSDGGRCNQIGSSATCDRTERIVWTLDSLPAGGGATFTFQPAVSTGLEVGAPIQFDVDAGPSSSPSTFASAVVVAAQNVPLELELTADQTPVEAGASLTYTLAFGHISTSMVAPSTVLTMPVPPGTSFVSASDGGMEADGMVEWDLGTLQPGQGGKRTIVVEVDPGLPEGAVIGAEAAITDASAGPNQSRATAVTRVQAPTPLQLSLEANPDPVGAGESLGLAVTVSNTSDFDLSSVVLTLRMPGEMSALDLLLVSGSHSCNTVGSDFSCNPLELIVWDIGMLGANNGITFTLPASVAAAQPEGTTVVFDAAVRDSTGRRVSVSRNLVVQNTPPLELALTEDLEPVAAGELLTYSLAFGHIATSAVAPSTVLTMPVPPGTSFVSASDGGMEADGVVEWDLGTLQPGQGGKRTLVVEVDPDLADGSLIEAEAVITDASDVPSQSRASEVTRVQEPLPLRLNMKVNPDPVGANELLSVAITASNTSQFDLSGVVVELRMPGELNLLEVLLVSGTHTCNTFGSNSFCNPTEQIVWDVGMLEAQNGITFTLPARVMANRPEGTTVVFDATARDSTGRRVSASRSLVVENTPSLELALTEDREPVAAGELLTYTLAFGHIATSAIAPSTVLTMPIPPGTSFVSASDEGLATDGVVEWDLGTLQPGQSGKRTLVLELDSDLTQGSLIGAEAVITDSSQTRNQSRATELTRVQAPLPLQLNMKVNPDPVGAQELLSLAITASNTSDFDLSDVVVTLRMPGELDATDLLLVSGPRACNTFGSNFFCNPLERIVWDVGTLGARNGITFTLPVKVAADRPEGTTVVFDAAVSDSTGRRVSVSRSLLVETAPALELALTEDLEPVAPGDLLTYTLAFGHIATSTVAPSTVLSMPVPPGTSFVAASDGGMEADDVVVWDLGTLQPGQSGKRTLVVEVDSGLAQGSLIGAEALIADASQTPNESRATAVTRVEAPLPLRLSMEVNPDPVGANEVLGVALTVSNTSDFDLSGVVLTLRTPGELSALDFFLVSGTHTCNTFGSNSFCNPLEQIVWDVGTVGARNGTTFTLPGSVTANRPEGTTVVFDAAVSDSMGRRASVSRSLVVENTPPLKVALVEDFEPVAAGNELVYTIAFGQILTAGAASSPLLSATIPPGTSFVAASDGGEVIGSSVQWSLGDLGPGQSGERSFAVEVDSDLLEGSLLDARASINVDSLGESRAANVSRVQSPIPLLLDMDVGGNPAAPGETLGVTITVTNAGGFTLSDVVATLRMPDEVDNLSQGSVSGSPSCNTVGSDFTCNRLELVVWNIGMLAAKAQSTFTLPPVVRSNVPRGMPIVFDARATAGDGSEASTRRVIEVGP